MLWDDDTTLRGRLPSTSSRAPVGAITLPVDPDTVQRYLAKRSPPDDDGHVWWLGAIDGGADLSGGYGRFQAGSGDTLVTTTAHRYAETLANGPITPGVIVRHRCDEPLCTATVHLERGTSADNRWDTIAAPVPPGRRRCAWKCRTEPSHPRRGPRCSGHRCHQPRGHRCGRPGRNGHRRPVPQPACALVGLRRHRGTIAGRTERLRATTRGLLSLTQRISVSIGSTDGSVRPGELLEKAVILNGQVSYTLVRQLNTPEQRRPAGGTLLGGGSLMGTPILVDDLRDPLQQCWLRVDP